MRIKLYIIIPIILFTIVYITYMDNNSNTDIDISTVLYERDIKAYDVTLPSKKDELVKARKKLASVVTEKTKENRQYSPLISKDKRNKGNENSKSSINEIEDIPQDLVINMNKLFETAKSKNWEEFNHAVEFLDLIDQQALNLALFQATINGAPINIIKELLGKGAVFSSGIINMLAMQNKLNLIKKLIPLGLDLYSTDKQGRSAIYYTLLNFNSKKTFDYLISQNVSTQSIQKILDPLDKALEYTIKDYGGIYYIDALLADGAQIQKSHKEYLALIKLNNQPAYIDIISKHTAFEYE